MVASAIHDCEYVVVTLLLRLKALQHGVCNFATPLELGKCKPGALT